MNGLANKLKIMILSSRWLVNILGLKTLVTAIYIIFSFMIIKKLDVEEYGIYSYVLALIVYFSTIPLLGFPVYLQRCLAKGQQIYHKYFMVTLLLAIIGFIIAFYTLPTLSLNYRIGILFIIFANCLTTILVSVHDGFSQYTFQYKFLFLSSAWMIVSIVQAILFKHSLSLGILLNYWMINSWIIITVSIILLMKLYKSVTEIDDQFKNSAHLIIVEILLLYSVSIPDAFARFYDRYLATKFITDTFLGQYSFNLMVMTTVYALFIRPVNSVLVTRLSKDQSRVHVTNNIIKKYYCYGLGIYISCYLMYVPFADNLLIIFGLKKYVGTIAIFKMCFLNAMLYLLCIPFATLIALSDNGKMQLAYCFISLVIFNIPFLLLSISATQESFFIGFSIAYFLNLVLGVSFNYRYAFILYNSMRADIKKQIQLNLARMF